MLSLRHQPYFGLKVPVIVGFKQTHFAHAPQRNGTRYYSHVYQSTLSYPYQIDLGFEYLTRLEFMVIPSGDHRDGARAAFFVDDVLVRVKELERIEGCRDEEDGRKRKEGGVVVVEGEL